MRDTVFWIFVFIIFSGTLFVGVPLLINNADALGLCGGTGVLLSSFQIICLLLSFFLGWKENNNLKFGKGPEGRKNDFLEE